MREVGSTKVEHVRITAYGNNSEVLHVEVKWDGRWHYGTVRAR